MVSIPPNNLRRGCDKEGHNKADPRACIYSICTLSIFVNTTEANLQAPCPIPEAKQQSCMFEHMQLLIQGLPKL
jgi:hypothetical protein